MEPLQPLRITNIGLAPGDVLGIAGVDKKHSETTCIEKLENRYPVDAGRFHDDGLDAAFRKPVYQPMEIGREGSEAAYWLSRAIRPYGSHVYDSKLDVQTHLALANAYKEFGQRGWTFECRVAPTSMAAAFGCTCSSSGSGA